jgi:hypothetical protein
MNEPLEHFVPLGTHLISVDGDTVCVVGQGTITRHDIRELLDILACVKREQGRLFLLYDSRQSTNIDHDARKLIANQRPTERRTDLQVGFGMSFTVRVLINMVVQAQNLLQKNPPRLYIFETEKEAREFFQKERDRIRRELGLEKSL